LAVLYLRSNDVEDIGEEVFDGKFKTYMSACCIKCEDELYFPLEFEVISNLFCNAIGVINNITHTL
jgi:hypothetical protein